MHQLYCDPHQTVLERKPVYPSFREHPGIGAMRFGIQVLRDLEVNLEPRELLVCQPL